MGRARSDVPDEVFCESFEKKYFHNLTDTSFIWLSMLSWKEKSFFEVPIRKSDPFEDFSLGLKPSHESRMMRKDILEK